MRKRFIFELALLIGAAVIAAAPAWAQLPRTVNLNDTVVLQGNVNPQARAEFDVGPAAPALPMERMILALRLSPDKAAALEALLAAQQDPNSASFHHWLKPEEFGQQFGPAPADIQAVADWLTGEGFVVEEVAKSGMWINFSGVASQVETAFKTPIRDYDVSGKRYHANAQSPSIPRAFAGVVAGVVSLHNFPRTAMNTGLLPIAWDKSQPKYTATSGNHYLSPGDFATIYNVNALYRAGIDGTGQVVAIVGRTHPSSSNWSTFRSLMALPVNPPVVILNGPDPGDLGSGEDGEADLDVEWSGAVAKNAAIKFVVSKSTGSTDGVDLSVQYIVNNNLGVAMSTSFGSCEAAMGPTENQFYATLWAQAAAQGITAFVSSGDAGAAGCQTGGASTGTGLAVNGLASPPYNVAVGGTQFNDGAGTYWNSTNGTGLTSVLSYIPEKAWNESGTVSGGAHLWATGGGRSARYAKPSWQVAPGVPADGARDIPDISLSAAGHDAYLVETQGALFGIGGTSASSPSAAGLMALIVQKTGQRQGNANIRFYQLGNAQYGSGGAVVFHDTTVGNNSVPGVTGFATTAGYDLSTGLGSVDANALVNNWSSAVVPTVPGAPAIGVATPGNAQASVSFGAAADNGSPISLYTATSSPGSITGTCGAPCASINVAGLSNGVAYTFTVTATNGIGTGPPSAASNSVTPSAAVSSNANLANLVLSAGTLSPPFASGTLSYLASVVSASNSITVTPTVADATATVMVNGVPVASGSASTPITLAVGSNLVTVLVTAQDGVTTKSYTVNVNYQQSAPGCTYALSPVEFVNLAAAGGQVTIAVTTSSGCPVGATSFQPWVAVTGIVPVNGGITDVQLQIAANAGAARATSIVVAEKLFLVTQTGP